MKFQLTLAALVALAAALPNPPKGDCGECDDTIGIGKPGSGDMDSGHGGDDSPSKGGSGSGGGSDDSGDDSSSGGGSGSGGGGGDYNPCEGALYSNAQCCSTDVLGVAGLDCGNPNTVPTGPADFQDICSETGQSALCCVLPVADQDVLCVTPPGVEDK